MATVSLPAFSGRAATVKAAWAEISGAEQGWSFPANYVAKPGERKPTGV